MMFVRVPVTSSLLAAFLLLAVSTDGRADPETDKLKERVATLEAEVHFLRERLAALESGRKPSAGPRQLRIKVLPGDWGNAGPEDITAVCRSAAQTLGRYFPARDWDPITVGYDPKRGPMVVFGRGADGERRVLLNSRDSYWAQFAYQFSHEVCHVLCNYREGNKANLWFEESLCETASLFTLRRMAEDWKTEPPYPNWKSYSTKLADYAADRLAKTEKLDGLTLAQWYRRNELELRKNGTDRARNQVVAAALLQLFEKNPEGWRAVAYLNLGEAAKELTFSEYLRDWHQRAPENLKAFVKDVSDLFEPDEK